MASSSFVTGIFLLALALCDSTSAAATATGLAEGAVNVTVYFESYCPDSVKFITKQLYPAYVTSLKDHMNISLIPYGKAKKTEAGGVRCDHEERECFGNKVIACALRNSSYTFPDVLKFVNCTSSIIAQDTKREEYPIEECVKVTPSISAEYIKECAKGSDGLKYLLEYGTMTEALKPELSSVPTIVLNEIFDSNVNKDATSDFRKLMCSKLKGTKLTECAEDTGKSAGALQTAVLPLVTVLVIASRV